MRKGKLGKIFVKYAEPIDLNAYIEKHQNPQEDLALKLTRDLYRIQQEEQPITMNSLIAATLMYYPREEIRFKDIKISTSLIYDYIMERGYKTYISTQPQNYDINQAALNLGFTVKGNPTDRKKGDEAVVNIKEKGALLKQMTLVYYGNQLGVYFSMESIICHAYSYLTQT